ncbi:cysteine-rich motor neuron 1 protein [Plakobranchus ocellatus]|uniref:Cysteine-rich motor neuron 1 protein n=1 Tax=Plakobranchus ocellatus TaxID=259542 RepID=A0AAV4BHZ3_9GAST|nr:cysteine-rich motor neuron 1 protein [Plakobranchus ocellatus]
MSNPAFLIGYLFSAFVTFSTLCDARVFSLLCFSRFQPKCPHGEKWDAELCECAPIPELAPAWCSPPRCPLLYLAPRCIVFRKDSSGCPTCDCECDELRQICPVNCPSGTEVVSSPNGCKVCKCRPNICRQLKCDNYCPFDRVRDSQGCPTCTCKPRRHLCPPVMCKQMCPYGTYEDTNNCPTCICKPKPICPILSCDNFCPSGREQDSNGCDVCKCKPIGPISKCPPVCEIYCQNGNVLDRNGCPTCKCIRDSPETQHRILLAS